MGWYVGYFVVGVVVGYELVVVVLVGVWVYVGVGVD